MLVKYIKKHLWVIITILLTALTLFIIGYAVETAPAHERDFHGIFVYSNYEDVGLSLSM